MSDRDQVPPATAEQPEAAAPDHAASSGSTAAEHSPALRLCGPEGEDPTDPTDPTDPEYPPAG